MSDTPNPQIIATASEIVDDFCNSVHDLSDSAKDILNGLIVTEMCEREEAITAHLAEVERERDKAKEDFYKAVENAGPCGACAEVIACGSTMHEHKECPVADRDTALAQLATSQAAMTEMRQHLENMLDEIIVTEPAGFPRQLFCRECECNVTTQEAHGPKCKIGLAIAFWESLAALAPYVKEKA